MTPSPALPPRRLGDLGPTARLALALFLVGLFGFYGLALLQVALHVGGGGPATPEQVLHRYHGDPKVSVLHAVLDPTRTLEDPRRMYPFLGSSEEECRARREEVLGWVERGAPAEDWPRLAPLFTGEFTCGMCHSTRPDAEGNPRAKADLPLETREQVLRAARPDTGMPLAELSTTSHNHAFGFLVAALLVSLAFTATRWRGPLVPLLVVLAFTGAALDIACWWLTKFHGAPWHWGVLAGGGAFGVSLMAMAVLTLDELVARSVLGRGLAAVLGPLRLGRLAPRPPKETSPT